MNALGHENPVYDRPDVHEMFIEERRHSAPAAGPLSPPGAFRYGFDQFRILSALER